MANFYPNDSVDNDVCWRNGRFDYWRMKVIRVLLLVKYAVLETRRMLHSRALIPVKIGKQTIHEDVVRNTLGFFLFFMSAFIVSPYYFLLWD